MRKYTYNCFTCLGKEKERQCYSERFSDIKDYCIFKQIADKDMENYKQGKDKFILEAMLNEFLIGDDTKILTKEELNRIFGREE